MHRKLVTHDRERDERGVSMHAGDVRNQAQNALLPGALEKFTSALAVVRATALLADDELRNNRWNWPIKMRCTYHRACRSQRYVSYIGGPHDS